MCRRNQYWGFLLMGLGAGLLAGAVIPSHFLLFCLGAGALLCGCALVTGKR